MTASVRRKLCLALVLPFVCLTLVVGAGAAQASPDSYHPTKGATFNNPYGGSAARSRINQQADPHHRQRQAGSQDPDRVVELPQPRDRPSADRAHHRGVSVRVIMDYSNWNPDVTQHRSPGVPATRCTRGNKHRDGDMTSWLRRCKGSCRGHHGIAHTKFYTFDKVQKTKDVVMYGSANATLLASTIQWNDIYT